MIHNNSFYQYKGYNLTAIELQMMYLIFTQLGWLSLDKVMPIERFLEQNRNRIDILTNDMREVGESYFAISEDKFMKLKV